MISLVTYILDSCRVKSHFVFFSIGMAFEAGHTAVNIILHIFMLIIHICLVVFVAINTGEERIITRIGMALHTTSPFALVAP